VPEADVAGGLVTDAMRAAVGREIGRRVSFPVSASDIRRWAVATYHPEEPPPCFWDPGHEGGVLAPRDFNPFAWMCAEPRGRSAAAQHLDAIEQALGIPGPGLRVGLNGSLEAEYGAPIRPGDVITAVRTLTDYRERSGAVGAMLLTTTQDLWTNQDGAFVARRVMTLIRYGR
jgi:hypothetical protein